MTSRADGYTPPRNSGHSKGGFAVDTVTVRDGDLAITVQGSGDPLLLVHGALIADSFGPMLAEGDFASSHRVISFHRRGFGASSPVEAGHSIADEAADAIAVLDHLGIGTAHVVGHSYGGAVVLQMALDAPERVHSLGLFEPTLLTVPAAEAFGAGVGPAAEKFQAGDGEGALLAVLTLLSGENPMERLTSLPPEATGQAVADIATLFTGDLPALSEWALADDDGRSIKQPALTVLGTESADVFQQSMGLIESLLPNTESFSLSGATHFLHMEKPAPVAGALSSFLGRHPISP